MTAEQKVTLLRSMMDGDDTADDILEVYLEAAGQAILNRMYPYREDYTGLAVPDRYAMKQIKIAQYMLNKRGAEGQIQHIENGVHRNYGDADIPQTMLVDVTPFAQAIR